MRRERHPALSSFLYALSFFGLLAQVIFWFGIGGTIAGAGGAFAGLAFGMFIFCWIACWYLEAQ